MRMRIGSLDVVPAAERLDLLAQPTRAALAANIIPPALTGVAEIDPALADTAAFCEHYGVGMDSSATA